MLFDKKKYYQYITTNEEAISIMFMLIVLLCLIIAIIINHIFIKKDTMLAIIVGVIIGIILGYIKYRKSKIKLEEMKMKLDIYNKIINGKNKE